MTVQCAWCADAKLVEYDDAASHGICGYHRLACFDLPALHRLAALFSRASYLSDAERREEGRSLSRLVAGVERTVQRELRIRRDGEAVAPGDEASRA